MVKLSIVSLYMIICIPNLILSYNSYITDNDQWWRSTSDFIPITGAWYGQLTIRDSIYMNFDIINNGPTPSTYLNVFRIGFDSFASNCNNYASRYPSLYMEPGRNGWHFSVSEIGKCQKQWSTSNGVPAAHIGTKYNIIINYNNSWITIKFKTEAQSLYTTYVDDARAGTDPDYFNTKAKIWMSTDSPASFQTPVQAANVTISNIVIVSYWHNESFTLPPTPDPTSNPTEIPSESPSTTPKFITSSPTTVPSYQPTNHPTIDPTNDPTQNPSDPPTTPTSDPSIEPSEYPTISPTEATSNPTPRSTNNPTIESTASDPTMFPSDYPWNIPSLNPSMGPTYVPSSKSVKDLETTDLDKAGSQNSEGGVSEIVTISIILCCASVFGCIVATICGLYLRRLIKQRLPMETHVQAVQQNSHVEQEHKEHKKSTDEFKYEGEQVVEMNGNNSNEILKRMHSEEMDVSVSDGNHEPEQLLL